MVGTPGGSEDKVRLSDLARVIRSKNAGPLILTLDLMFPDAKSFERARTSNALTAAAIAARYGLAPDRIQVIPFAPAHAIKLVLERPFVAGSPGDRDVYGAQQHLPLMDIEL